MLEHQSVLLGNIILGQFPLGNMFAHLRDEVGQYCYLVDGLQRLSVGTALLAELDPLVLTQNHPRYATVGIFYSFVRSNRQLIPIYQFNDLTLKIITAKLLVKRIKIRQRVRHYLEEQFENNNGRIGKKKRALP